MVGKEEAHRAFQILGMALEGFEDSSLFEDYLESSGVSAEAWSVAWDFLWRFFEPRGRIAFRATLTLCEEIKPGEAFSTAGPEWWGFERFPPSLGEKVYLRTHAPCPPQDVGQPIYRIEVVEEESDG